MRAWKAGAAGAVTFGLVAAARARERRAAAAWEREVGRLGPTVDLRGERVHLPFVFHRSDGFTALVGADAERIRAALPSPDLHPVRLPDRRAAVMIAAYHHRDQTLVDTSGRTRTAPPYGEVLIAALVTPRPAPSLLPLLLPDVFRTGGFVLHLPVTSRLAMDAGRLFGLPKFVADMAFTEDAAQRSVEVVEGGQRILSLRVRPAGRLSRSRTPAVTYSVRNGELLKLAMPGVSLEQLTLGGRLGRVELGDHPVAEALRVLGLAAEPFATSNVVASTFLIPEGRVAGQATAYPGYAGVERDFGRYTVSHAGTPPIDQYAHRGALEWWVVPKMGATADARTPGELADVRS